MKRQITFKTWLSVFFGGILQFIRNIFSWKNKTPFWRVIWSIITICVIAFTFMLGYAFYDEFYTHRKNRSFYQEFYDGKLSSNYKYHNSGLNEGKSFIYDTRTKKKVMTGIDWIAVPENGDSLIVVAKDGKRGYLNRFTAKMEIPLKYDAAWIFTDGVAGVCEGESVYFIDHKGNPINDKKFERTADYNNYAYHGNFAAIPYKGKFGLIDRKGDWWLQPEYDDIHIGPKNMWYVCNNEKWGVIGSNGEYVLFPVYKDIYIHSNNGITVMKEDNSRSRHDYEGNIVDNFIFDEVFEMAYYINEFDDEGNQKRAVDDILKYSSGYFYGLITRGGKPVTPPLYSDIESVAPGVYRCGIPDTYEYIMINSKGEKINP